MVARFFSSCSNLLALLVCMFGAGTPCHASNLSDAWGSSRVTPVYSKEGMVVAEERLASEVGAEILAAGGNAVAR